jgi:hypothetical protein
MASLDRAASRVESNCLATAVLSVETGSSLFIRLRSSKPFENKK